MKTLITGLILFVGCSNLNPETIDVYPVSMYKCMHTDGRFVNQRGVVAVFNDTLFVSTKLLQYKGVITHKSRYKGSMIYATDDSIIAIKVNVIMWLEPRRRETILFLRTIKENDT